MCRRPSKILNSNAPNSPVLLRFIFGTCRCVIECTRTRRSEEVSGSRVSHSCAVWVPGTERWSGGGPVAPLPAGPSRES